MMKMLRSWNELFKEVVGALPIEELKVRLSRV